MKTKKINTGNLKKMLSYYRPYLGIFWADMFFATLSSAIALTIPLVVRYVTSTLVIAHRLTTIQNAEKILVLTEEGIAESGSHKELLEKGGIYEKLYHMHQ